MDKKQIVLITIVGLVIISLTIGVMYKISNKDNNFKGNGKTEEKQRINEINVGNYTIKYGKYKGVIEEYNPDTETMDKEIVYIEITNTMIKKDGNALTYSIKGDKLNTGNGLEYEVIANNKIELLVGGGIIYEYNE